MTQVNNLNITRSRTPLPYVDRALTDAALEDDLRGPDVLQIVRKTKLDT